MTAQIIPFPRLRRGEEDRVYAEFKARSDARLAADPWAREVLARAQRKAASLPKRKSVSNRLAVLEQTMPALSDAERAEYAAYLDDLLAQCGLEMSKLAEVTHARALRAGAKVSYGECVMACKVAIDIAREP